MPLLPELPLRALGAPVWELTCRDVGCVFRQNLPRLERPQGPPFACQDLPRRWGCPNFPTRVQLTCRLDQARVCRSPPPLACHTRSTSLQSLVSNPSLWSFSDCCCSHLPRTPECTFNTVSLMIRLSRGRLREKPCARRPPCGSRAASLRPSVNGTLQGSHSDEAENQTFPKGAPEGLSWPQRRDLGHAEETSRSPTPSCGCVLGGLGLSSAL